MEKGVPIEGADFIASQASLPRKYFSSEGVTDPETLRQTYGYNEFTADTESVLVKLLSAVRI